MHAAYDSIYFELKHLIEVGEYPYRSFLPSESILVRRYGCAHNTVRKALAALAADGYAQPIHGKGVRVIFQSLSHSQNAISGFSSSGIQSFQEAGKQYGFKATTRVTLMEELLADATLAERTHFEEGEALIHFERVRLFDDKALARETNYFRKDIVAEITQQDAERSVYDYIENKQGGKLVTSKRRVTVEHAGANDQRLLELGDADYLAIVRVITFDGDGLICEYGELRYHPSVFSLDQTTVRTRING